MADKDDKSKKVKRAKMAVKVKGSPHQVIKALMKLGGAASGQPPDAQ